MSRDEIERWLSTEREKRIRRSAAARALALKRATASSKPKAEFSPARLAQLLRFNPLHTSWTEDFPCAVGTPRQRVASADQDLKTTGASPEGPKHQAQVPQCSEDQPQNPPKFKSGFVEKALGVVEPSADGMRNPSFFAPAKSTELPRANRPALRPLLRGTRRSHSAPRVLPSSDRDNQGLGIGIG